MTDRITCSVPGCKNSSARWKDSGWYLCGPHWRAVPKRFNRRRNKVMRALVRRGDVRHEARTWWLLTKRAQRVADLVDSALVRAAIRAAAGL